VKKLQKIAYLTIDDAPSKDFRQKVDFLLSKNIPAIWFCRGDLLQGTRESDLIYAIGKGFVIANHSFNHPRFSQIDLIEAKSQIEKTDKIIEEIYSKANVKRPAKLFRFPYGDKGGKNYDEIQKFLGNLGYLQPKFDGINYGWFKNSSLSTDCDIFWTFDLREWCLKGNYDPKIKKLDDVISLMHKKDLTGGELANPASSEIILIHDHLQTTNEFPIIVEELLKFNLIFRLPGF